MLFSLFENRGYVGKILKCSCCYYIYLIILCIQYLKYSSVFLTWLLISFGILSFMLFMQEGKNKVYFQ